jgi:hypothetical protein
MPRNIAMKLTQAQILDQTKTVTRRCGWQRLKPGTILQPVVQSMGLKKGQQVERIGGPIEVTGIWREPLGAITQAEVIAEGFPQMNPAEFVRFFCASMNCDAATEVTRIGFRYL